MADQPHRAAGNPGWLPQASPADQGFAPDIVLALDEALAAGRIWNVHGLVVVRHGCAILERYFAGEDRRRGVGALGKIAFTADTLHDLRSCSKALVGLLYGIALENGQVPPPESALFDAFPAYAEFAKDGRDRLTIHHLLAMSMGTDWDESSFDYADPRNSETAMDNAPDRYRYVLERPVVDPPGARWTYCGGATALLARIIAMGTGKALHTYAREALFQPLGVAASEWVNGDDGEPIAASGARLSTRDLARIGLLMLADGEANGRAIVPAAWLARCITPHVSADELRRFGYQWFVLDIAFGQPRGWAVGRLERMWMAQGEGGQRLFVFPALQLVIAVTAGNYGQQDQWVPPTRILRDIVLAHLRSS